MIKKVKYGNISAIEAYGKILNKIDRTNTDLGNDSCFVQAVVVFFGIKRRSVEFVREFCCLIRDSRNDNSLFDIAKVSEELARNSESQHEISFASKVLHLADRNHSFVIYDSNVRKCFDLDYIKSTAESYKILSAKFATFKNELQRDSQEELCVKYRQFIEIFDEKLNGTDIVLSDNKKIDFYLWKIAKYLKK